MKIELLSELRLRSATDFTLICSLADWTAEAAEVHDIVNQKDYVIKNTGKSK